MLWVALRLPTPSIVSSSPAETQATREMRQGLATWALQFTPRVAWLDEAVVMELRASVRLFGGLRALHQRLHRDGLALGATALAWAPNSLAALALARAGVPHALKGSLHDALDPLPLAALSATAPHRMTLSQLGCQRLGQLRALPRPGLTRRLGPALLHALDQLYGQAPIAHPWIELPERFEARLSLMHPVESAPALLFGARRLLLQLGGWLAARHEGACAIELQWTHDTRRSQDEALPTTLRVATRSLTRDVEHWCRLLGEQLAQLRLSDAVTDLTLRALDVRPMAPPTRGWLPDPEATQEAQHQVLERLAARLGSERVVMPVLQADHRPEWMQRWQPVLAPTDRLGRTASHTASTWPQPSFVLEQPLPLKTQAHRPLHQGPLQLVVGPHRVDGGWWHRVTSRPGTTESMLQTQRDYWIAVSPRAGVLWIFQTRQAADQSAWFLHGIFA